MLQDDQQLQVGPSDEDLAVLRAVALTQREDRAKRMGDVLSVLVAVAGISGMIVVELYPQLIPVPTGALFVLGVLLGLLFGRLQARWHERRLARDIARHAYYVRQQSRDPFLNLWLSHSLRDEDYADRFIRSHPETDELLKKRLEQL